MNTIPLSRIKSDPLLKPSPYDQGDTTRFDSANLEIGIVLQVDYANFTVVVRATNTNYQHQPIPLTFAGAGARHFLGSLPQVGDICALGWTAGESGRTKQPVILGWLLSGTTPGFDWWAMQEHSPEDWGYTPEERAKWEGVADRRRFKLRPIYPGNVMGSSAQGSDFILDESVTLLNRRGNQIKLRDQDQAVVVQSLQQFHAGAGFRSYHGMIQRDALLLPTSLISDGIDWAGVTQTDASGKLLSFSALGKSIIPAGKLTPNPVFDAGLAMDGSVDPYVFLQNGLIIDAKGRLTAKSTSDAVYGGKPFYRLSTDGSNAAVDSQAGALTEYRIEVQHTSDGTLPVTEQTDGFDADRLPDNVPREPDAANSKAPFVEHVLGSVVGNDPFSIQGKLLYGQPLRASHQGLGTGVGYPLAEHAATLLKVSPIDKEMPTYQVISKGGDYYSAVAGTADYRYQGGATVTLGGLLEVQGTSVSLQMSTFSLSAQSLSLSGAQGVSFTSGRDIRLKASNTLSIEAPVLDLQNVSRMELNTSSAYSVNAGDNISHTSKTATYTSLGKSSYTFGGPKDGVPTNGALRETQFAGTPLTGFVGGDVDSYAVVYGDRTESFQVGNHTTSIQVGNLTYRTVAGSWKAQAGANSLELTPGSAALTTVTGNVSLQATAGAMTLSAGASMVVSAVGATVVRGASVLLNASVGKVGGIISQADADPISGLPLGLLGMGSTGHLLGLG